MKCLLLQICTGREANLDDVINDKLIISKEDYKEFFVETGIIDKLNPELIFRCGNCNSFVLPAAALYKQLDDLSNYDFDGYFSILKNLTEEILATDEEWLGYFVNGTPHLSPLHIDSSGTILAPEWAENPVRLKYEDVMFTFRMCEFCDRLFKSQSSNGGIE